MRGRTLHVARHHRDTFGGVETVIEALVQEKGACLSPQGLANKEQVIPIDALISADMKRPVLGPAARTADVDSFVAALTVCLDRMRPQILHLHNLHFPYEPNLYRQIIAIGTLAKCKIVISAYDYEDEHFSIDTTSSELKHKAIAAVVTVSQFVGRRLAGVGVPNHVIPGCIGIAHLAHQVVGNGNHRRIIGYPGRLVPCKGQLEAISIAKTLNSGLLYSAPTPSSGQYVCELKKKALAMDVSIDFQSGPTYPYASVDVVAAFPTHDESQGLTPLEAVATGIPAVAARRGGLAEYSDIPGIQVVDTHHNAFATAIESVFGEPARWQHLAAIGAKLVNDRYSPASLVARLDKLYTQLLAEHLNPVTPVRIEPPSV